MDQAVATPTRADAPQPDVIRTMALAARAAARVLARSTTETRNKALTAAAMALRAAQPELLAANARDVAAFAGAAAFRDRLILNPERVEAMAQGLEQIAALPDPVGHVMAEWDRPNGLRIRRVATPVGVIGMIYESRPNVGADAAALCIKSGNAVILRGGSDSLNSARVIHAAMQAGLKAAALPVECVQIPPDADRAHVAAMLGAAGLIDLIIPRGGKSLVERVCAEARVPVLAHAEGLCHTYVHAAADLEMARRIVLNAKLRRPGICGATETLLVDQAIAPRILPGLIEDLATRGCTFRADERAREIIPDLPAATDADFATEWLDAVLSVGVVDGVEDALVHIARYGSAHTEAIVTEDAQAATTFLNGTDSAVVMWNASTQFCDGGEFGFGAEIGIATGRFHARGPVGLEQLTTFRYEVIGTGQVRP
ncbi:glutamate-5-semialdehyde dehydrogenase [Komagataeibacter sucrofermentans]|uniref:Gamma-glutamyl phosphate reductase n=1 Tax=Komagataeibacter sucrofermentans TaxID=1053551 RepID=A0A318QKS2_9PROT|nr:glutamate-5-semialdehyde dehydrogenase [Komagataeibacter sucrofermentans]PYD77978.1 glutamate-5-semialdehyde dehydrogenase [Komagataeibacter sucrofermentans]GBQ51180.1 gamma-glutamyl phosphate reductase [Komagataeibacter sucrofermentans DSM 15973]